MIEDFNKKIIELWNQYENSLDLNYEEEKPDPITGKKTKKKETANLLLPNVLLPVPEDLKILFVGLNPSDSFPDSKKHIKTFRKENPKKHNTIFNDILKHDFSKALKYENCKDNNIDELIELEQLAHSLHAYFQKYIELSNSLYGLKKIYHIDLYQFRMQNSNILVNQIIPNNKTFFDKQKKITFDFIEKLKPDLIFVANAKASHQFKEHYNIDISNLNEDAGCYEVSLTNKCKTLIMLSGMISQTRNIDIYSFERLKWHFRLINKHLKKP